MSRSANTTQMLVVGGLAAAASVSLVYWYLGAVERQQQQQQHDPKKPGSGKSKKSTSRDISSSSGWSTPPGSSHNNQQNNAFSEEEQTPLVGNRGLAGDGGKDAAGGGGGGTGSPTKSEEKALHARIEELDKKGKALFKNKQFIDAAQTFTEALDLISEYDDSLGTSASASSSSLSRQLITLLNNRSAMYEKANMPELALDDCSTVLELEVHHGKARTRKLRILESLKRWYDALVEICAMQLLFMQANRTNLRMGLPTPPPPVPQSKMEEVLAQVVPEEVKKYSELVLKKNAADGDGGEGRPPPSSYTILQLLKSYTGYHKWMAAAAQDGAVSSMKFPEQATDLVSAADRATGLWKRGRRHVYDGNYKAAMADFEEGYVLIQEHFPGAGDLMEGDGYARLLEWAGMGRHWQYRLDAATECYEKCIALEPQNPLILVKQAGVCMDGSWQAKAMHLFEQALKLDPKCVDALLHRSNLYMIQGKAESAKQDLEKCVQYNPNHVMARLRLASILAATQDPANAKKQLDAAERVEPNSSDVQSYRGELFFTQNQMDEARKQFEKAMQLEPKNPTPYVNAAMAILNTPPTGAGGPNALQIDAQAAIRLLEQALEVDPQFMAAYVQLGQLKLGTAVELSAAREVIDLYDRALLNCRTPEDLKELCSMRILAVAQVEAATLLKMESFNLQ